MQDQVPIPDSARAPERVEHHVHEVAEDIAYFRTGFVNLVMCGFEGAGARRWILIDAGLKGYIGTIRRAAGERFGFDRRGEPVAPDAIVLTHGHFDHVGCLRRLADEWDCPIYAHALERPFLDGRDRYPRPDPWVGGMMALASPLLPRGPIDVRDRLHTLPGDGSIPGMPGWRWVHTPGHTPGHVSLWRERDRTLIAGDAVVTTRQESVYDAATQRPEVHGPPMYFTPDWHAARESVRMLAALEPELLVTGHGRALGGPVMRRALHVLAGGFDQIAVPRKGRRDLDGTRRLPPEPMPEPVRGAPGW
jgi:glyoxylase-like metal-dependent hydrolase (beta-lactamase superfamily II)